MLNPPTSMCSTFILTSAHFSHSLPTATIKGYDKPSAALLLLLILILFLLILPSSSSERLI